MRFFGYSQDEARDAPLSLREVSILASPQQLRRLASFLTEAADAMERHGPRFGHEHFSDHVGERAEGTPDLIVCAAPEVPQASSTS